MRNYISYPNLYVKDLKKPMVAHPKVDKRTLTFALSFVSLMLTIIGSNGLGDS